VQNIHRDGLFISPAAMPLPLLRQCTHPWCHCVSVKKIWLSLKSSRDTVKKFNGWVFEENWSLVCLKRLTEQIDMNVSRRWSNYRRSELDEERAMSHICTTCHQHVHRTVSVPKLIYSSVLHRESKKGCHPKHGYNFVRSWSICKILSLLQTAVNFQQNSY